MSDWTDWHDWNGMVENTSNRAAAVKVEEGADCRDGERNRDRDRDRDRVG